LTAAPGNSTGQSHLPLIGSMSLAIFLAVTAITAPGPLLVDMAAALGTTVPVVGQLVSAAAATWAITAVAVGPVSDAYGRQPVLLLGICLIAAGCLGVSLATNFAAAMACSLLIGIGGGMVPPTCIALAGDTFSASRQPMTIATLTTMPGLSSVLGVPTVAVLGDIAGWRACFLVLGLALTLAAALVVALVPYHRPQSTQIGLVSRLRWATSCPVTMYMAGTNLMSRVTWGVMLTFFPAYLIITYELGTAEVALPVAIVALGATAAPMLAGRIGSARRRLPITAALLLTATLPGLAVFFLGWGVWFSVLAAGLFMLLVVPVTTILSILFAETGGAARGTLAGIISCTNWGGTAAGAALGGLLVAHVSYGALSFLLAGAIVTSGLLMTLLVNDRALTRAREHFAAAPVRPHGVGKP